MSYLRLSIDDDNKTVRLVKVVEQLNYAVDVSNKLQEVNFQRNRLSIQLKHTRAHMIVSKQRPVRHRLEIRYLTLSLFSNRRTTAIFKLDSKQPEAVPLV